MNGSDYRLCISSSKYTWATTMRPISQDHHVRYCSGNTNPDLGLSENDRTTDNMVAKWMQGAFEQGLVNQASYPCESSRALVPSTTFSQNILSAENMKAKPVGYERVSRNQNATFITVRTPLKATQRGTVLEPIPEKEEEGNSMLQPPSPIVTKSISTLDSTPSPTVAKSISTLESTPSPIASNSSMVLESIPELDDNIKPLHSGWDKSERGHQDYIGAPGNMMSIWASGDCIGGGHQPQRADVSLKVSANGLNTVKPGAEYVSTQTHHPDAANFLMSYISKHAEMGSPRSTESSPRLPPGYGPRLNPEATNLNPLNHIRHVRGHSEPNIVHTASNTQQGNRYLYDNSAAHKSFYDSYLERALYTATYPTGMQQAPGSVDQARMPNFRMSQQDMHARSVSLSNRPNSADNRDHNALTGMNHVQVPWPEAQLNTGELHISSHPDPVIRAAQKSYHPTQQILRKQGLLGPAASNGKYIGDLLGTSRDEENLPDHLNCSLWVVNIPKFATRQDLFGAVRVGAVAALHISSAGEDHMDQAAKLVFKQAEAAAEFLHLSKTTGIFVTGGRLKVRYNRHGVRAHDNKFDYQTRVVEIEVITQAALAYNHPEWLNPEWWVEYANALAFCNFESIGYLPSRDYTTKIELRFERIVQQAQALVQSVNRNECFKPNNFEIVTIKYGKDPCQPHQFPVRNLINRFVTISAS